MSHDSNKSNEAAETSGSHGPLQPKWYGALRGLYQELDAEIQNAVTQILATRRGSEEGRPHLCERRGVCCNFPLSRHRLFATSLEVDYSLRTRAGDVLASTVDPELCPFWTDGLCAAREERPIGCRTYFCDPEWQEVGARIHEDYHRRAQRMSEAAGFPYQYGPYVSLLRERASPEPDRR